MRYTSCCQNPVSQVHIPAGPVLCHMPAGNRKNRQPAHQKAGYQEADMVLIRSTLPPCRNARLSFALRSRCLTEEPRPWRTPLLLHCPRSLRSWSRPLPATGAQSLPTGAASKNDYIARSILPTRIVPDRKARTRT